MSIKHPIISVTGSSGAGTTSVKHTFEHIFRREEVNAAFVQGDAFHRYARVDMERAMSDAAQKGNPNFSHFGPEANLFEDLETLFRTYAASGTGKVREYIHDHVESHGQDARRDVHRMERHRNRN